MSKRIEIIVSLDLPPRVTIAEIVAYVRDAVASHNGAFSPDEALFHLDRTSIHARKAKAPK